MKISRVLILILVIAAWAAAPLPAEPDWDAIDTEAIDLLGRYVRIRSVNPPANTTETAAERVPAKELVRGVRILFRALTDLCGAE